jgi:hypothetical protein
MRNVKRFKFAPAAMSVIFFAHSMLFGAWSIKDMGDAGRIQGVMNDVVVGALRTDSITRVYASNSNTQIYEFTYSAASNNWNKSSIGTANAQAINSIASGNGRNDGVIRLYAATRDSHIYELTATSGTWSCVDIGASTLGSNYGMLGLTLGNGRNDGIIRIYAACDDTHIYEFPYSAGAWSIADLGTAGSAYSMSRVSLGNGRNDGINRIYASNTDSNIYEFTWSGSAWQSYAMGANGSYMRDVAVGNGRSDGINRVYGANANGRPYEYEYSAALSTWSWFCVDNAQITNPNSWLERLTLAAGRNDGVTRLYGANHDTSDYEFSYGPNFEPSFYSIGSSTFTKSAMGSAANFMQSVAAGNGRNDGKIRIYSGSYDYHLYEYTYSTSTILSEIQSNNNIANSIVYPTFINLSKGDKLNFANFTPNAEIIIITLAGHTVIKIQADDNGLVAPWDGTIEGGGKAASGTYIVHSADNKGNFKVFKILLIK